MPTKAERAIQICEEAADALMELDLPTSIGPLLRKLRAEAAHIRKVAPLFEELAEEI